MTWLRNELVEKIKERKNEAKEENSLVFFLVKRGESVFRIFFCYSLSSRFGLYVSDNDDDNAMIIIISFASQVN